jgi:hypothetical protein
VGLLCDALLRVVMAYSLPVDTVPALDGVLYAASWIGLQVITQVVLFRTRTLAKIFGDRGPGRRSPGQDRWRGGLRRHHAAGDPPLPRDRPAPRA